MAATFLGGAEVVQSGNNYTAESGTDTLLVWVPTMFRSGTSSGSNQSYGGTSMAEREDISQDLTGGADPTCIIADLVDPATSSNALALTWANTPSDEAGYALTAGGVDQVTPLDSSDSTGYTGNTPNFTINAPANSFIVYFKHHGSTSSQSGMGPPDGFAERHADQLIISPAFRNFKVWTRSVTTALTSFDLSADTTGTAFGGVHGYAVYNEAAGVGGGSILPFITNYYREMQK